MIPNRIQNLFQFIDFLHSNIDTFNKYDYLINELYFLGERRHKYMDKKNFIQRFKHDLAKLLIEKKIKVIKANIISPIENKATRLKICDVDQTETLWNWNINDVSKLKKDFNESDVEEVLKAKRKYFEFRTRAYVEPCFYFYLRYFFDGLDQILKALFEFFKETKQNDFEQFEARPINEIGIKHGISSFETRYKELSIPDSSLVKSPSPRRRAFANNDPETIKRFFKSFQDVHLPKIFFKTDDRRIKYNHDNILNPDNWEQRKEIFFDYRMEKYPKSYTLEEKINLELEKIEDLNINVTDNRILKQRYKDFLHSKTNPSEEAPQPEKTEKLADLITSEKNNEIVDAIKEQYKNIQGKRLKLLLMAMQDLSLLPKDRIALKFHNSCKKEFNWNIATYNAMNGYTYNERTDENELDEMKASLKEVLNTK